MISFIVQEGPACSHFTRGKRRISDCHRLSKDSESRESAVSSLIKIHGPFANIIGIAQNFQEIDNGSSLNFRQSLTRILQIKIKISIRSIAFLQYS
jgi:hypothetical protein